MKIRQLAAFFCLCISNMLHAQPGSYTDLLKKGREDCEREQYAIAIPEFDKAIQKMPDSARGYLYRGIARYMLRNNDGALIDYNKSIKLDPKNSKAYFNRGLVEYDKKEYQKAIEDYTRAIKIDSTLY